MYSRSLWCGSSAEGSIHQLSLVQETMLRGGRCVHLDASRYKPPLKPYLTEAEEGAIGKDSYTNQLGTFFHS